MTVTFYATVDSGGLRDYMPAVPVMLPACVASVDSAAWNGMFGKGRERWRNSGKSQARFGYEDALPGYLGKIEQALAEPKQMDLWEAA